MKNIIISPHLDDAVFSLGATIAAHPEDFIIVTVFGGVPWPLRSTEYDKGRGFSESSEAMHARKIENQNALSYLGVSPDDVITLDLLDNQYLRGQDVQTREMIEVAIESAISDIAKFRGIPKAIYSPLALPQLQFRHIDHLKVAEAMPGVDMPHQSEWILYADQPYNFLSLHEDYTIDTLALAEEHYGSRYTQENSIYYHEDATFREEWIRKINACKLYESQYTGNIEAMLRVPIEVKYKAIRP